MKYILVFILCGLTTVTVHAQSATTQAAATQTENNPDTESVFGAEVESETDQEHLHFPVLTLGGAGGFILRNESAGGFLSGSLDFVSDWVFGGLNLTAAGLANSPNDWLFTEISGYGHLLAIGASDVTYRRYIDGDEFRLLAGFSYTRSHEDIVRVDVNLGVDYFSENQGATHSQEWGLQIGARVRARFWRIENFLQFSFFQNLEVGTGEIDLSGTEIICIDRGILTGGDLMCTIPPPDPEAPPSDGSGLVNWQTTGFLITERLFLNLHEEQDGGRIGPEIELRFEKTPLRDFNFWAMVSFRYYWSVLDI